MLLNFQYVASYCLLFIQQIHLQIFIERLLYMRHPGKISEQNRQDHYSCGVYIPMG